MKKVRIICDWQLLVMVIVLTLLTVAVTLVTMFVLVNEDTVEKQSDLPVIRIMFSVLLAVYFVSIIASSPRYLCIITLSDVAITIWMPFRKQHTYTYKQFRYLYCGKYFHGNVVGIGKDVWYIIVSQQQLRSKELNQVNQLANSHETIKIRYTKKNYYKLKSILPITHIKQLEIAQRTVLREP